MNDYIEELSEVISNTLKAIRATHDEKHEQLVKQRKEDAEKQCEYIINSIRTALEHANANVTGDPDEDNKIVIIIEDAELEELSVESQVQPDAIALMQSLCFDFDDDVSTLNLYW